MATDNPHAKLVEQIAASLPKDVVHTVTVHIAFRYVTNHPVTGEEIEIKPELVQIGSKKKTTQT